MPPKATPLKVPTNGMASALSPLTPRASNSPNPTKLPASASGNESANKDESGETTLAISSPLELTTFVDTVLKQLESKFTDMSQEVLGKMNEMSNRIDALELSLQDLLSSDLNAAESPRPASTTGFPYSTR